MKTKFYFTLSLLLSTAFAHTQQNNQLLLNEAKVLPADISDDWFQQASRIIGQMEYEFYPTENNHHQFRASNSVNRIAFMVRPTGYSVQNMQSINNPQSWQVGFTVMGISKGDGFKSPANFAIVKDKAKITYQSTAFDIEYVNQKDGLRQNFIIHQQPNGVGPLEVKIMLSTSLETELEIGNKLLFYQKQEKSVPKLMYEDLKVWDALNRPLTASMQLDKETQSLSLIVEDAEAVYPVTIDPLNRTPEWTTSADGILPGLLNNLQLQVQTLYGYTVAGLGDINGDSYDDVAVSAPGMADVITGTGSLIGVGAVFIYLGSTTGLPVMPSKVLQPTTAVAGALFGFSIDAGDITGDGKNDIVIGAPLDRYQTTAAGLIPTNVNVTAGKVYLYRSEDLFVAPNPSPFLQVRLQGTSFFSTGLAGVLGSNVNSIPLFGFSVAVTDDLDSDSKADLIIGSPMYLSIELLAAQTGAAFVYYSSDLATTSPVQLEVPTPNLLGLVSLPLANTNGLLFGFSVDGLGDYNSDGKPDLVVGAPAGIDLSSLGGIFSGQVLGGSAYVYYGKNNGSGINNDIKVKLHASPSGLLSNAANLFGYKVKGVRNVNGARNGNILVGAPVASVLSNVINGLQVKAGEVHVFKKKASSPPPATPVLSDQTLSSPRSTSILSLLSGQTLNVSMLYGAGIDNMLDVNCDGFSDIIIGEPLSTAVPFLGADVVGGAAYIYLGNASGTYNPSPFWDLTTVVSPLLGINATALLGHSVAGAGYIRGRAQGVRSLIGGPANALDFGTGLLDFGNTLGTLFNFTFDGNGLGKAYSFPYINCNTTLPALLLEFDGRRNNNKVDLNWTTLTEDNVDYFELQHSTDGTAYQSIALIFSKGEQRNDYMFFDKHPHSGNNYYRLKIVDKNGRLEYSNTVLVRFDYNLPGDVLVAPNPVQDHIRLRLIGLEKGFYQLELRNTTGQLLQRKMVSVSQFSQTETMHRDVNMPTGVYWLNVYHKEKNRLVKIIKIFMNN